MLLFVLFSLSYVVSSLTFEQVDQMLVDSQNCQSAENLPWEPSLPDGLFEGYVCFFKGDTCDPGSLLEAWANPKGFVQPWMHIVEEALQEVPLVWDDMWVDPEIVACAKRKVEEARQEVPLVWDDMWVDPEIVACAKRKREETPEVECAKRKLINDTTFFDNLGIWNELPDELKVDICNKEPYTEFGTRYVAYSTRERDLYDQLDKPRRSQRDLNDDQILEAAQSLCGVIAVHFANKRLNFADRDVVYDKSTQKTRFKPFAMEQGKKTSRESLLGVLDRLTDKVLFRNRMIRTELGALRMMVDERRWQELGVETEFIKRSNV